jgi:hypothetical protein
LDGFKARVGAIKTIILSITLIQLNLSVLEKVSLTTLIN